MTTRSTSAHERREAEKAALLRVQRRVGAIGFFTIAEHGILGVIGAAYFLERQGRHGSAVGLAIMSGVMALVVYAVTRTILGRRLWSPAWIALALVPTTAAFVWVV
jgi:hypothetical protein